jgi:uncharacterized Tic20 family protein
MFIMHISLILAYGTLLGGTVLLIWSLRNAGAGSALGKAAGYLIIIFSLLSMLCISFYGIKYWNQGHYETPMEMHQDMMKK